MRPALNPIVQLARPTPVGPNGLGVDEVRKLGHEFQPRAHSAAVRERSSLVPFCIPSWYTSRVTTEQIAVRLPEELLAELDDLVQRGVYDSRAAAVRAGITAVAELDRRRTTDSAVIAGYRRTPPTKAEEEAAIASLREAILEEPW
jgi:Arc/MetJ-type ribon-helix-helix transcriptional regulator